MRKKVRNISISSIIAKKYAIAEACLYININLTPYFNEHLELFVSSFPVFVIKKNPNILKFGNNLFYERLKSTK